MQRLRYMKRVHWYGVTLGAKGCIAVTEEGLFT